MPKYSCPRCDKGFSREEIQAGRCENCGLGFKISAKTDAALFDENALMERLAEEIVKGKPPKLNHYEKAIELLKGYLSGVVCTRRSEQCTFYLVRDQEIVCFLLRLVNRSRVIHLEFDSVLRGLKDIVPYKETDRRVIKMSRVKSYLKTRDFDYAMQVALYVYQKKSRRYGIGKFEKNIRFQLP